MVVGIAVFELHLPASRSLKDKRRVVKSLVERLHERLRLSAAETGFHDLHQRSEIGVAVVSRSCSEAERLLGEVRREAEGAEGAFVTKWDSQLLEEGDL